MSASEDLEAVRAEYRPSRIRVLMLGESPPPSRGFFYTCDSTLYRVSLPVFDDVCNFPRSCRQFLAAFMKAGFYLDDFSSFRGDHPNERPEAPEVRAAVDRLALLISDHHPVMVLGVLERISYLVAKTVEVSNHPDTPWRCLPFPYHKDAGKQARFTRGLREVLEEVGCSG